jgi:hypothetical protein
LGKFNQQFDYKTFKEKTDFISKLLKGSQILTGITPYLLYFNLPEFLIQNELKALRLYPNTA